jgi:hypothetical protein
LSAFIGRLKSGFLFDLNTETRIEEKPPKTVILNEGFAK